MSRTVNFLKENTDIFAGTTIVLSFAVVDDDAAGIPVDISLWTDIQFDMNDDEQNPDAGNVITKNLAGGVAITDGPGGILEVTIDPADTSGVDYKTEHNHYWSLTRLVVAPITMLGEGRLWVKGSPFQA